ARRPTSGWSAAARSACAAAPPGRQRRPGRGRHRLTGRAHARGNGAPAARSGDGWWCDHAVVAVAGAGGAGPAGDRVVGLPPSGDHVRWQASDSARPLRAALVVVLPLAAVLAALALPFSRREPLSLGGLQLLAPRWLLLLAVVPLFALPRALTLVEGV